MTDIEIATKLADHENRVKVCEHRLTDLERQQKEIQTLTISVHDLATSVKNLTEQQKDNSKRLDLLEDEPGENWKLLIRTLITALVGAFIGYILNGGI